jgi:hypothetical protein
MWIRSICISLTINGHLQAMVPGLENIAIKYLLNEYKQDSQRYQS